MAEPRDSAPSAAGTADSGAVPPQTRWERARWPLILFVVGLVGYALPAWDRLPQPSPHIHFVDLAESFLNGRLDTDFPKGRRGQKARPGQPAGYQEAVDRHLTEGGKAVGPNDWASYRILTLVGGEVIKGIFPWKDENNEKRTYFHAFDGTARVIDVKEDVAKGCDGSKWKRCDETRYYVSFPPFPAILILPVVALVHYDFNDVIFTIFLAALNLVLIFLALQSLSRRGLSKRTAGENAMLAILFGFGTVHYFSGVRGEVWFTALILGVTLNTAYIMAAVDARKPLLAGLLLALGMATRTPIAFCAVFFGLQLLFPGGQWRNSSFATKLRKGFLFAFPVLLVGGLLMAYNYARFDNAFEFGHTFLMEGARPSIRDHGLFSTAFLNNNLSAAITNMPRINGASPFLHITRHGLGLIATSPFLLLVLWPRIREWDRRKRFFHLALWITVGCAMVPALLYQNTGWAQFGYRFSLDWMPYLFALLAIGGRPFGKGAKIAFAIAIAVNLFGAITFGRFGAFYYD